MATIYLFATPLFPKPKQQQNKIWGCPHQRRSLKKDIKCVVVRPFNNRTASTNQKKSRRMKDLKFTTIKRKSFFCCVFYSEQETNSHFKSVCVWIWFLSLFLHRVWLYSWTVHVLINHSFNWFWFFLHLLRNHPSFNPDTLLNDIFFLKNRKEERFFIVVNLRSFILREFI